MKQGKCFLVATPIGNLEDITYRAVKTLGKVDIIACEDTRQSIKLLNHYKISTKLISYHQHNEQQRAEYLCQLIKEGKDVAIISDAGMPAISDPGEVIVKKCIEENIELVVIPGPSASLSALIVSGLNTNQFTFYGFLPVEKKLRKETLDKLRFNETTMIFYEAPHKLINTLKDMYEILDDRKISIVRELTKLHEEIFRGTISQAIDYFQQKLPRGEFVLVVEGYREQDMDWANISLEDHFNYYLNKGLKRNEAVKQVAKDRGVPKREIYEKLMRRQ